MQYDLVFEGGGAKGSVFVGALKEFFARGHTARRVVGTSAGAITATLLAAGYTPEEMLAIITEKLPNGKPVFSSFMDLPKSFTKEDIQNSLTYTLFENSNFPNWIKRSIFYQLLKSNAYKQMFSFVEAGGLYAGDTFLHWIETQLEHKGLGLGEATFANFYKRTEMDLSLIVSDTSGKQMLILNHRTVPHCPVAWAVRMSMSIPFVWQEVEWNKEWGEYLNNDITGHIIVDGGVLSNFPINLLTYTNKEIKRVMGDTDPYAVANLGFLIDETKEVKNSGKPKNDGNNLFDNLRDLKTVKRINALIETMTSAHDNINIRTYKKEICKLPAKGYGVTEFDMEDERLMALVDAGQEAMKKYFDRKKHG